jgi:hypothetical protein
MDNTSHVHDTVHHDNLDAEIRIFHKRVFSIINQWATQEDSKLEPMWATWKKWLWQGLKPSNTFQEIMKVMKVQSLQEYVTQLNLFTIFQSNVEVQWVNDNKDFTYHISCYNDDNLSLPTLQSATDKQIRIFKQDLDHLSLLHEVKMELIQTKTKSLEDKLMACEHMVKTHFIQYKDNLLRVTADMMETTAKSINDTIEKTIAETMTQLYQSLVSKIDQFEQMINKTVDDVIQDVYVAAEAAHNAMNTRSDDILHKVDQHMNRCDEVMQAIDTYHQLVPNINALNKQLEELQQGFKNDSASTYKKASQWNHISMDMNFKRSPNPYEQPTPVQSSTTQEQQPTGVPPVLPRVPPVLPRVPTVDNEQYPNNRFRAVPHSHQTPHTYPRTPQGEQEQKGVQKFHPIPQTVLIDPTLPHPGKAIFPSTDQIPILNHDAALKRAKIQYTGLGEMFVFYSQLLNGLEQFGVFLTPLSKVTYHQPTPPTAT